MEDFDKILWGFIFATVATGFGWVLNQIGHSINEKKENKRNLKLVLFNLLEIYFILKKSNYIKLAEKITDKVLTKIPSKDQNDETKRELTEFYTKLSENLTTNNLLKEFNDVEDKYNNSIELLAKIDPITAYVLKGKTQIFRNFEEIKVKLDNYMIDFQINTDDFADQTINILKPDIIDETTYVIKEEMIKISKMIGLSMYFKTKRKLKQINKNVDMNQDETINELFDKLINKFK